MLDINDYKKIVTEHH